MSATYKTQVANRLDFIWACSDLLSDCKFCCTPLRVLGQKPGPRFEGLTKVKVYACPSCGWWVTSWLGGLTGAPEGFFHLAMAQASLRNLDQSNIKLPLEELRRYLVAKYDERYVLRPKTFEEIVGGVFADFGYNVRVTAFSGDDGVDAIVLDGLHNDTVGVQVKRYGRKIEAEQIRSFAGALVLNSLTKGIFITTSSFTRGARLTAKRFLERGIRLDLWNSEQLYDKLRLSQRLLYDDVEDESAPFSAFWQRPEAMPTIIHESW